MKKSFLSLRFIASLLAAMSVQPLIADEGMWLPSLIGQNHAHMERLGLKLGPSDIYSADSSSLKDAVVMFGGGCTGEVVSSQGLVLTNHHCGYGYIQRFSSIEHDYLTDGFWAASFADEIYCPGLQLRFMRYMEDVTDLIIGDLDDYLFQQVPEQERNDSIAVRTKRLTAALPAGYEYRVEPFYDKTRYYLFCYEVCNDVRLVGAPPSNIGKFGGDTDNWMFPRHTGDFSIFRIYADSANNPGAPYSPDNKPYTPRRWFQIDLNGYNEGDFTMVMGYPYTTKEYISSYAVEQVLNQEDPMRIEARTARLGVIREAMEKNPETRIQYASKAASIANGWKKWQGEIKGLESQHVLESKREYEKVFNAWGKAAHDGKEFMWLLPALQEAYTDYAVVRRSAIIFEEHTLAAEAVRFAYSLKRLCEVSAGNDKTVTVDEVLRETRKRADAFYKDYDAQVDRKIFEVLIDKDIAANLYEKSIITHPEEFTTFLAGYKAKRYKVIEKDPMYRYALEQYAVYSDSIKPALRAAQTEIDSLQRLYMKGQRKLKNLSDFWESRGRARSDSGLVNIATFGTLYPDANFTMRVAYGQVAGFKPAPESEYIKPYTTIDGIMEKENPEIYDYVVEPKLKELWRAKDYGRYANALGEMPVAFIGTNHTTGGNSGSPVLNAEGRLIGINFDRNWEGTMSDIRYAPELCRNIMLDIRYCLFIVDKFAGAQRLIDELDIF